MSRRNTVFTLDRNFEAWENWLKTCQGGEVDRMRDRVGRTTADRGLQWASFHAGTPVTSRLSDSLKPGGMENYLKVQLLPTAVVVIYGSCVPYAAALEKGYDQKNRVSKSTGKVPSLFVPGYWQGDTFKYVPGYKTGMVLTGRVVEGKHMFEKSLDELRDGDVSTIYLNALRELWSKLR